MKVCLATFLLFTSCHAKLSGRPLRKENHDSGRLLRNPVSRSLQTTPLGPPNLALGKPAKQSSTGVGGVASRAVDGNTSGLWSDNSTTHTKETTDPFWEVNLQADFVVGDVKVYNRGRLQSRLDGASITLYDKNRTAGPTLAGPASAEGVDYFVLDFTDTSKPEFQTRFVVVSLPGSNRTLSMAEVEVFEIDYGLNLALGKPTNQSSTAVGGVASRAVDGNPSGIWSDDSTTHTKEAADPFWEVNLKADFAVGVVKVYNRGRLQSRLNSASVTLYDTNRTEGPSLMGPADADGVDSFVVDFTRMSEFPTRYVVVSLSGSNRTLSLAEVEVFEIDYGTNLAVGKPTSQSSTGVGGVASRAVDGNTSGKWSDNSTTHTKETTDPSWEVDLEDDFAVGVVQVYNSGRLQSRLDGASVTLYDWNRTEGPTLPGPASTEGVDKFLLDFSKTSEPGFPTRYVVVSLSGSNRTLSLAEVKVFGVPVSSFVAPETQPEGPSGATSVEPSDEFSIDTTEGTIAQSIVGPNLSLGKPTSQSSTGVGGVASRAVDGNTSGRWSDKTITHTKASADPSWEVDLESDYCVYAVRVYNRGRMQSRLDGSTVTLYDGNMTEGPSLPGPASAEGVDSFVLDFTRTSQPEFPARHVVVSLTGSNRTLSLAEVEVFGVVPLEYPAFGPNVALGKPATQSSTAFGGAAIRAVDGNTTGTFRDKSVTHTKEDGVDPFWEVDLVEDFSIRAVKIYNRSNRQSRLDGSFVTLYDMNKVEGPTLPGPESARGVDSFILDFTKSSDPTFPARFVMVSLLGANKTLNLAEVEVYGSPLPSFSSLVF